MFIIIDVCSIVECISNEVFLKKYQKSELNIILTIKLMKQYYKIIKNNEKFFQENPRSIKLLNHICKSNHYWTDDSDKYNFYCDGQIPKEDLYLLKLTGS